MRSKRCTNNVQIFRCSKVFWDCFGKNIGDVLRWHGKLLFLFACCMALYIALDMKRFSLLMTNVADIGLSWRLTVKWSPLLFVFDPGKRRTIKKRECIKRLIQIKSCIYIWKWETLGNKSSKYPLEPRQREIRQTFQSGTPSHNYIDCTTL